MGRVFLGESRGGRKVAIKVVHPHYANDPEFRRRFAREVAAARQVGGFHTAGVVGADPDADPPWMATAYIPGPSLAEAVAQGGPLGEAEVRQLGAALAEGLAAIHECGLIHRDLKPSNVIMADDGPRIIDFGIAKGADATALTGSGAVIGTLRYMSPEQLQGQELTARSDVFALGAVLGYAATGHDAFPAPTIPAVLTRILTSPPDLDPLSGELRAIIADCLAKEPGDRPSTGDLLDRFSRREPHAPTEIAAPAAVLAVGPVPSAVPPTGPRPAEANRPAQASPEPSFASTVNVSPVVPAGRTAPSAVPADLPAARVTATPRPARRGPRRRRGLIAAGAAVVVALAAVGIFLLVHHPAGPSLSAAATLSDPGNGGVTAVAFGPNGVLAADGEYGTYLWNTVNGKITDTLKDSGSGESGVESVAFGPGGVVAGGGGVGNAKTYLWNTADASGAG
jgi:hypothetical protein